MTRGPVGNPRATDVPATGGRGRWADSRGRCARCRTAGARCGAGTWARSPNCRPPAPGSASRLGDVGFPPDGENTAGERLVLAFDELASNALRHGESPVVATVVAGSGGWLLDVSDRAPETMPAPAVDRDPAQGGLGLHLVARLAVAHGWYVDGGAKHVWACLPTTVEDREPALA